MGNDFTAGMAEAMQMTRDGRVSETTALIQRLLGGGAAADARPAPASQPAFPPRAPQAAPRHAPPAGPRTGLRETLRRLAARKTALDAEIVPGVGPAAIPDGARYEAGSFHDVHGARDYRLYVPAAPAPSSEGRPLLVMLHGCTQTPDDFARGTRMNAAAEEAGCVVLYPAQPSSANPNRCWNWFRPEDQRRDAGEPALIAGMVRSVIAAKHVDPGRVYVAGLSAGGAAAAVLGTEYPDVFAAVGVHSGLPHGAARDVGSALAAMRQGARGAASPRPVRMIVFHGDADRTVSPANAEALAAQAAMGAPDPKVEIDAGDSNGRNFSRMRIAAEGRGLVESWTLHGAGHAWSGGDASGSHTDARGPDASREMLRFFLQVTFPRS